MNTYSVNTSLRLRSAPEIKNDNIITVLPAGTVVKEIGSSPVSGWIQVEVAIKVAQLRGFVSTSYITKVNDAAPPPVTSDKIEAVHLPTTNSGGKRSSANGRAYPLKEINMPTRDINADEATKISQIAKIIEFLDVEHSIRYLPGSGVTYCNIYAFDFFNLSSVYMPRVWWTGKALSELAKGKKQEIRYGDTVGELNANSLYNWFNDFGDDFGWTRVYDLDYLQAEVNKGKVGVIVGQRKILSRSGHITAVVPENTNKAIRVNGKVTQVLQSQAGVKNKKYFTGNWYLSANFRAFGFWLHD